MWTPPLFSTASGKYYLNKKYWKGLDALESYVTNEMLTEVCGRFSLTSWSFEPALRAPMILLHVTDFSDQKPNKAFELQVPTRHEWAYL